MGAAPVPSMSRAALHHQDGVVGSIPGWDGYSSKVVGGVQPLEALDAVLCSGNSGAT